MNRTPIGIMPRGMTGTSLITEEEPDVRNAFDLTVGFDTKRRSPELSKAVSAEPILKN